jgi:hypothetical protein
VFILVNSSMECLVGCHCSHCVLTDKIGIYRCPFGSCVKREASQK